MHGILRMGAGLERKILVSETCLLVIRPILISIFWASLAGRTHITGLRLTLLGLVHRMSRMVAE
jgi:hypothetical protein